MFAVLGVAHPTKRVEATEAQRIDLVVRISLCDLSVSVADFHSFSSPPLSSTLRRAVSGARSRTRSQQPYSTASSANSHLFRSKSRWIVSGGLPVKSLINL